MSQSPVSAGGVPEGYTVERELGDGPFGRVLLCRQPAGGSAVVRILGVTGDGAAALETELRAAATVASHPCAVSISRIWSDSALGVCFEQAHCPGGALSPSPDAPMDPAAVAAGGVRLTAALAHSHRLGLLHGDVCPANVLIDADGQWCLADGGVAQALHRAKPDLAIEPDPTYAPRELQGWETPAEPSDVYALGATLSALLLGSTEGGFLPALSNEASGLGTLLVRMLAPNPADRPSLVEVDEVLRAQVPAPDRAALPAAPTGPRTLAPAPRPKVRLIVTEPDAIVRSGRRKTLVVAGAIGIVFVAGAGAVAVSNSSDDSPATAVAQVSPSTDPSSDSELQRLTPINVVVTQVRLADGRWHWWVRWKMAARMPDAATSWTVGWVNPTTKDTISAGKLPFNEARRKVEPTLTEPWGYYREDTDWPLSRCARVRTNLGETADSPHSPLTTIACPDPAAVREKEAANAKLDAAAKSTPKPSSNKNTPKPAAKKKVRAT